MQLNYPMKLTVLTGIILGGIFSLLSYYFNICEETSLFLNNKLFILVLLSFISGLFLNFKISNEYSSKDCARYNFYSGVISALILVFTSLIIIVKNYQHYKEFGNYVYIALIFAAVFLPMLLLIISPVLGILTYNLVKFFQYFNYSGFKENIKLIDKKKFMYQISAFTIVVFCFFYVLNNPCFHLTNFIKNPLVFAIITFSALILLVLSIICVSNLLELLFFKDKIKQNIKIYQKIKVKELLLDLSLFVPSFTVLLLVKAYYNLSPFLSFGITIMLFFIISIINNILLLKLLGTKLKEGEKYDFWVQKAFECGIKIYPILIIPYKGKKINIYSLGIKNLGLIVVPKNILDNLSKEQFAVAIANETYRIESNQPLINLLFLFTLLILCIFLIINTLNAVSCRAYNFPLYFSAIFMILLVLLIKRITAMQKYKVDHYSKTILNNGDYK